VPKGGVCALDDGVNMSDLSTSLNEGVFALIDDAVRGRLVLEPDNSRLLLINSQGAWGNRESGGDKGKESHVDSGIGDKVDDRNLLMMDSAVVAIKV
jgi:hypothetical protein